MPVKVKGPAECTFCANRKKKSLGPCGHHGGPGNAHGRKKGSKPKPANRVVVNVHNNGSQLAPNNSAKETAERLLGQLEQIRLNLDTKIAAVKELVSVL